MDFISNQKPQIAQMLKTLGIKELSELWSNIPESICEQTVIDDDGLSEFEGKALLEKLASQNSFQYFDSYLGCGAYEHHVPALVKSIISKSGFLTAYTPYQPESSQGVLQTIFEFQSVICRLTGMEVANASLYDGASACAEALMMALRIQRNRKKVLVARNLHPNYQKVISQYLEGLDIELIFLPIKFDGCLDFNRAEKALSEDVCAILLPYPNFFGFVEDIKPLMDLAHQKGILNIISANPMVFGLYKSAKELGADIVVGESQPFGIPLQFGGPYSGFLACLKKYVRQIPGRLVGKTEDCDGNQGFVLTLQTREQHIRREKATSNICSNQALCALASLVGMLWYGPEGIRKLSLTNYQRAEYLKQQLNTLTSVELISLNPIFNEFTIKVDKPIEKVLDHFRLHDIEPGVVVTRYFPHMENLLTIAVTETKSLEKLNKFIEVAKKIL